MPSSIRASPTTSISSPATRRASIRTAPARAARARCSATRRPSGSTRCRRTAQARPTLNAGTDPPTPQTANGKGGFTKPLTTPNLGRALIAAGKSFAGYSQDLPQDGSLVLSNNGGPGSGVDYQRKHNPWSNWQADNPTGNQLPASTNLTFNAFPGQKGNPFAD